MAVPLSAERNEELSTPQGSGVGGGTVHLRPTMFGTRKLPADQMGNLGKGELHKTIFSRGERQQTVRGERQQTVQRQVLPQASPSQHPAAAVVVVVAPVAVLPQPALLNIPPLNVKSPRTAPTSVICVHADPNVRLVVLYGGRSAEHDVSCVSAGFVAGCAASAGMDVEVVGITREGAWVRPQTEGDKPSGSPLPLPASGGVPVGVEEALSDPRARGTTVVFPALHGPFGEDGAIQGFCETLGIPYVGAGVLASAVCMDKPTFKALLQARGVPVARWSTIAAGSISENTPTELLRELGCPLFVKPANMGSSVGITKAADSAELLEGLRTAAEYDEVLLVEEAVANARELEVSVIGNTGELRSTPPGEVVPSREFYDYDDKYVCDAADLHVPARIPLDLRREVESLALKTASTLRVEGLARVDFLYGATSTSPGRQLFVSELNTMPGFTPISMFPRCWAAAGLSGEELVAELVRLALERQERRSKHKRLYR